VLSEEGYSSEILASALLSIMFMCSTQSFRSEIIASYFIFLGQGTVGLNNLNSGSTPM
jgi:hypothetical protein